MSLDASPILEGLLYQGSAPPLGQAVEMRRKGFSALVLCAREYQPEGFEHVGLLVFRVPMDDVLDPPAGDVKRAATVAKNVAHLALAGHRVLVTCAAGRNRSGLVTALALREMSGESGAKCAALVRRKRQGALTNPSFLKMLARLPAKK